MRFEEITEEIELITEAGDAQDAIDLAKRLAAADHVTWAIRVRRTVVRGQLDRKALREVAGLMAAAAVPVPDDWSLFADLRAMEAGLRAALAADAAMPRAARRARSAQQWADAQRREERVREYNELVERVNRERGREHNLAQAEAVLSKTCSTCFQVPAANGVCGC